MRTIDGYVFINSSGKPSIDLLFGAVKEGHAKDLQRGQLYESFESNNLITYRSRKEAEAGMRQLRKRQPESKFTLAHLVMKLAETHEECESFVNENSLIFVALPERDSPDQVWFYGTRVKERTAGFDTRCELVHNGLRPYRTYKYVDMDYSWPGQRPRRATKTMTAYKQAGYAGKEFQRQGCGLATLATFKLRRIR